MTQDMSLDVKGTHEDQLFRAKFIRKGDDWVNVVCDLSGRWETGALRLTSP